MQPPGGGRPESTCGRAARRTRSARRSRTEHPLTRFRAPREPAQEHPVEEDGGAIATSRTSQSGIRSIQRTTSSGSHAQPRAHRPEASRVGSQAAAVGRYADRKVADIPTGTGRSVRLRAGPPEPPHPHLPVAGPRGQPPAALTRAGGRRKVPPAAPPPSAAHARPSWPEVRLPLPQPVHPAVTAHPRQERVNRSGRRRLRPGSTPRQQRRNPLHKQRGKRVSDLGGDLPHIALASTGP